MNDTQASVLAIRHSVTAFDPLFASQRDRENIDNLFRLVLEGEKETSLEVKYLCALVDYIKEHSESEDEEGSVFRHGKAQRHLLVSAIANEVFQIRDVPGGTFAKGWADLLESGKYKQSRETLRGGGPGVDIGYCCLGVLCDSYLGGRWVTRINGEYAYSDEVIGSFLVTSLDPIVSSIVFGRHASYLGALLMSANDIKIPGKFPDRLPNAQYEIVISVLRLIPKIHSCGILFRKYEWATKFLKKIYE